MTRILRDFVLLFCLLAILPVRAQDYPSRTITIIDGYALGGGADIPARYFAQKLAPLATQRRSGLMPELPTMDESGLAGFDLPGWFGAWLPAGVSPAVVKKPHGWFNEILSTEETRAFSPTSAPSRSSARLRAWRDTRLGNTRSGDG